jgi:hypothetical protein
VGGPAASAYRRMTPISIPTAGLDSARRIWGGKGELWAAAASVAGPGIQWTADMARRRAARVVLELVRPHLVRWPNSLRKWIDALPANSVRQRSVGDIPTGFVDWRLTRARGWPPRTFALRSRQRLADTLLLSTLRWTLEELVDLCKDVEQMVPGVTGDLWSELRLAEALLELDLVAAAGSIAPTSSDLALVKAAGRPWNMVAAVSRALRVMDHDPHALAQQCIKPDPELADRLFHIAAFGLILRTLESIGWNWRPRKVMGMSGGGPIAFLEDAEGLTWDLWFEAGGAWSFYKVREPFNLASAGVSGTGGPLGADVALVLPNKRAVLFECKFSANPSYVAGRGFEQVLAYAAEATSGLVQQAWGVVVGPSEVVEKMGMASTSVGDICIASHEDLPEVMRSILMESS